VQIIQKGYAEEGEKGERGASTGGGRSIAPERERENVVEFGKKREK